MSETPPPDLQSLVQSDFVRCKLCSYLFTGPLLLPCLHTVCTPCLQTHLAAEDHTKIRMASNDDSAENEDNKTEENGDKLEEMEVKEKENRERCEKTTFKCPECKTIIPTPKNGITSFQDNYFLMALVDLASSHKEVFHECDYCRFDNLLVPATSCCLECHDDMCGSCTAAHRRTKLTRHHQVVDYKDVRSGKHDAAIRTHQKLYCKKHADQPVRFYCNKCDVITCGECKLHDHAKHNCSEVRAAGETYANQTKKTLSSIKNKIPNIRDHIKFLADYDVYVKEMVGKCRMSVENQATVLHKLIDKYKDGLLKKLEQARENEHDIVSKRTDDLEAILYIFRSTSEYLSVLLELGKPEEILGARRIVKERLSQLSRLQLEHFGDKLCLHFTAGSTSKPSMESVFGKVDMLNLPLDKAAMTTISERQAHIYDVTPCVGETVELILSFECHSPTDQKEVCPSGIDVDEEGNFYIVDQENKKVKVYDPMGAFIREFGQDGDHGFSSPFDVTLLGDGELAVSDSEKGEVKIFSTEGDYNRSFCEGLEKPFGITRNVEGNLLVLDSTSRCVTTHNPASGSIFETIPDKSDDDSTDVLTDAQYVTTNANNYVIVSDWSAPNIKIFDPQGCCLTKNIGNCSRPFQPKGICTDKLGYIFVADSADHRVHLLAPDGRFIRFLVSRDEDVWHPIAVKVNTEGHLVVTEALGKVKVFRYI